MEVVASAIAAALATESARSTLTGEARRSANAPKMSGETNAASPFAAKAKGLMACRPWASSTVLNGTSHIPSAAPRTKNIVTNSRYPPRRIDFGTRLGSTEGKEKANH